MRPVFMGLLSSAVGSLAFLAGAHLTFPDDAALKRLRYEIEDRSRGEWALEASDADLHWLTGISLDDATLYKVKKSRLRRKTDEAPEITPYLSADRVSARVQLLALLRGGQMIDFDADMYGGNLSGSVGVLGDEQRLFAEGRGIDLSRMPLSGEDWSANLTGLLNIDSDLALNREEIKDSEGSFKISIDQLTMTSDEFSGFKLDQTAFTEAVLAFKVDDGVAKVTQGHFVSDLLEATVTGEITLNKDFKRWRVRLNVVVTLSDTLDKMARFSPALSDARDDDGNYHFMMAGTPGMARLRPDRLGARGDKGVGPGTRMPFGEDEAPPGPEPEVFDDEPSDGSTADDRRQRRLERIRKARERRKAREAEAGPGGPSGPGLMRPGMGPDGTMGRNPGVRNNPQDPRWQDEGGQQLEEDNFPPLEDEEPNIGDDELDAQPYE